MSKRFNCYEWRIPHTVAQIILRYKGQLANVETNIDFGVSCLREVYRKRAMEILDSQDREEFISEVRSCFGSLGGGDPLLFRIRPL